MTDAEQDARRYRYIRDALAQMHSPKMNGEHSWRVGFLRSRGSTFDIAIDRAIEERENERDTQT